MDSWFQTAVQRTALWQRSTWAAGGGGGWVSHLERGECLWPDVHGERLRDVERDLLDQASGRHRHCHPDTHTHPEEQRPLHSDVYLQRQLVRGGQHAALRLLLRRWGRGGAGPAEGLQVQAELPVSNDIAGTLSRMQPRRQRYRGILRVGVCWLLLLGGVGVGERGVRAAAHHHLHVLHLVRRRVSKRSAKRSWLSNVARSKLPAKRSLRGVVEGAAPRGSWSPRRA